MFETSPRTDTSGGSRRKIAVIGLVAAAALGVGIALAVLLGDVRQVDRAVADPAESADQTAVEDPSASATPSWPVDATERASATPSVAPSPSATPLPTLAATPRPTPTVAPTPSAPTFLVHWPPGMAVVTTADGLRLRSQPSTGQGSTTHEPLLSAGIHLRLLEGPLAGDGYWWYRTGELSIRLNGGVTEGWLAVADRDGTPWIGPAADSCAAFPFTPRATSVQRLEDLQAGIIGTWGGCVSTPWVEPYWVTISFRADGTYSSRSFAAPDGLPALYYGTDDDSPEKRYALLDIQDSLNGVGQIDIVFWEGNTNRGDLRNVKLMGDQLEFEFFHRSQYGPLIYRLYRQ